MIKERYTIKDFVPLIVIFLVILALSVWALVVSEDWMITMRVFMGSFFVIFGFLKVLKLRDFAEAYQMYDLIARRSRVYALAYPFIELALGVMYLIGILLVPVTVLTFVLMGVSAVGVYFKLRAREVIMCACLGTVFRVPMTWVTLFEDLLMALMAVVMFITFF